MSRCLVEPLYPDGRRGRILYEFTDLPRSPKRALYAILRASSRQSLGFDIEEYFDTYGYPSKAQPLWVDRDTGMYTEGEVSLDECIEVEDFFFSEEDARYHRLLPHRGIGFPSNFISVGEFEHWLAAAYKRYGRDALHEYFKEKDIQVSLLEATGGIPYDNPITSFVESVREGEDQSELQEESSETGEVIRYPTGERITQTPDAYRLSQVALADGDRNLFRRAERNIEAIETLLNTLDPGGTGNIRDLMRIGSTPSAKLTDDQKSKLCEYVGWGGIPQIFEEGRDEWDALRGRLKEVVSSSGWDSMVASTLNAHYTTLPIIRAMYEGLEAIGYDGKGRALEAGCGVGHFIGCSPSTQQTTGIEADQVSAKIAEMLYEDANIHHTGFERYQVKDEFDLAIGNPPFGSERLFDATAKDLSNFSIHNYFIHKSMRAVRPGGVGAFVVSRFFMDTVSTKSRERLYEDCDLLGAVRLPDTAFSENAGTRVVSDVLVFRKRLENERPLDGTWIQCGTFDDLTVNRTFLDAPEKVLGKLYSDGRQQQGLCITVRLDADDPAAHGQVALGERLSQALCAQLEQVQARYVPPVVRPKALVDTSVGLPTPEELGATEDQCLSGGLIEYDGAIFKVGQDIDAHGRHMGTVVTQCELSAREYARLSHLLRLRDAAVDLVVSECDGETSPDNVEAKRELLNTTLDDFLRTYKGDFGSRLNRKLLDDDLHAPLVFSLYDDLVVDHPKATILEQRVSYPATSIPPPKTIEEAYTHSLISTGGVDAAYCADALGLDESVVSAELLKKGLCFKCPDTGGLVDRDSYLSGDIAKKLRTIEELSEYEDNRRELMSVLPDPLDITEIAVTMSADWVPTEVFRRFILDVAEIDVDIVKNKALHRSFVKMRRGIDIRTTHIGRANERAGYGTERRGAIKILEDLMNSRPTEVFDYIVDEDGNRKAVLNHMETARAKACAARWVKELDVWMIDPKNKLYTNEVADVFNNLFRSRVNRVYDGSHLQFPGMASDQIKLRKTQRDAAWRMVCEKRVLLDHVVGAGKTYTAICGEMEKHRLGKASKSMVVVPNHLVQQWSMEILKLYPSAKVLVMSRTKKEDRQRFFAKAATGKWDMIVCPESAFTMIPVSKDAQIRFLEERVRELEASIESMRDVDRFTVKQVERAKKNMETRIRRLQDKRDDPMFTWETMGVDSLVVDEAHSFKNLEYQTGLRRVSGLGPVQGSKKAFDLLSKLRVNSEKNPESTVTFLTGTPISNTLAEGYHIMRYMCPDALEDMQVEHFDSWIGTFGKVTTEFESNLTGTGFVEQTRISKFRNIPELQTLYGSFADVVTNKDLERNHIAQYGRSFPMPKIRGGRPDNQVGARSEEVAFGMEEVVQRLERIRDVDSTVDNPLKCLTDARKRGLDMRIDYPDSPDDPSCRVERAAHNIVRIYEQWDKDKGTQLVFCDMSIPKTFAKDYYDRLRELQERAEQGDVKAINELAGEQMDSMSEGEFSVYSALKDRVLALARERGLKMDPDEFRFIHEANTDLRKQALFEKVRSGEVRILMGSTSRMGTGMNVQERLVAEHDLDAPWRPADMEQRSGRILRQGNLLYAKDPDGFEVELIRYSTERTAGSKEYQTLETKAKFIEQFRKGHEVSREAEDIMTQSMSFTEMRALTSGRDEILEEMKLRTEINGLEQAQREWESGRRKYEDIVRSLEGHEARTRESVARLRDLQDGLNEEYSFETADGEYRSPELTGIPLTEAELDEIAGGEGKGPLKISAARVENVRKEFRQFADRSIDAGYTDVYKTGDVYSKPVSIGVYKDRLRVEASVLHVVREGMHTYSKTSVDIVDNKTNQWLFRVNYDSTKNAFSATGLRKRMDVYIDEIDKVITRKEAQVAKDEEAYVTAKERCAAPFPSLEMLDEKTRKREDLRRLLGLDGDVSKRYQSNVPRFRIERDGSAWTIEGNERLMLSDLEPDEVNILTAADQKEGAVELSLVASR